VVCRISSRPQRPNIALCLPLDAPRLTSNSGEDRADQIKSHDAIRRSRRKALPAVKIGCPPFIATRGRRVSASRWAVLLGQAHARLRRACSDRGA
jgi:hypothetical protein